MTVYRTFWSTPPRAESARARMEEEKEEEEEE